MPSHQDFLLQFEDQDMEELQPLQALSKQNCLGKYYIHLGFIGKIDNFFNAYDTRYMEKLGFIRKVGLMETKISKIYPNPQASEVSETVYHSHGTSHRCRIGHSNPLP